MKHGMVFPCPVCKQQYWTQNNRNKHMSKAHPGVPHPPVIRVEYPKAT